MGPALMVGVDCSECGDRAVKYAAEQARKSDARLYVTHVIEWSPFSFSTVQENAERHKRREEEIQRAHGEIIDPIVAALKAEGVDAEGLSFENWQVAPVSSPYAAQLIVGAVLT